MAPIVGYPDAFRLIRLVNDDYAALELDGTTARLFVQQIVVVEDERCKTESYIYRLQTDASTGSWRIRWDYRRDPPRADYDYPRAHVHVNGTFPDGEAIRQDHIPAPRMPLEFVIRYLITDRGVKPRTEDWQAILKQSAETFGEHPAWE